ncbi:TetR/AcrR family transcriptional regulator [Leifsonia poae]|uniref:TetR/AcrR family transcriptional regulator n=1 Tax=Leifsonia poae TaxID=110933 RepID=UPI001CBE5148|nr:TetR family transcriptional regulator C-terminal domain-containing protein [Leifsonia poae]
MGEEGLSPGRRAQFLEAAAQMIAERSFANTRLSDVARHLGVSAPLLVHYFGTREHLLTEALTYTEDRFYDLVSARLRDIPDAAGRLAELITICCSPEPSVNLPQGWALWFEIWIRAAHDAEAARSRTELDGRWFATVAGIIQQGQDAGEFRAGIDAEHAARMITALLDGLSIQIQLADSTVTPEYALDLAFDLRDRLLGT